MLINDTLYPDLQNLLAEAVEKWGKDILIVLAIEELSELQTELCHYLRGRSDANVSEEAADVILMLCQLVDILNIQDEMEYILDSKIARLRERLAAGGILAMRQSARTRVP
jgi:NTP pyrophosphatase (non-canonical NTP hydrolase)